MNKHAILSQLDVIRNALFTGQISSAKVDAQRALAALCIELETVLSERPEREPPCEKHHYDTQGRCYNCPAKLSPEQEPRGAPIKHEINGHIFIGTLETVDSFGNCDRCGEQFGARFVRPCPASYSNAEIYGAGEPRGAPSGTCATPGCDNHVSGPRLLHCWEHGFAERAAREPQGAPAEQQDVTKRLREERNHYRALALGLEPQGAPCRSCGRDPGYCASWCGRAPEPPGAPKPRSEWSEEQWQAFFAAVREACTCPRSGPRAPTVGFVRRPAIVIGHAPRCPALEVIWSKDR